MKYRLMICLILFLLMPALSILAQNKPDNVCYINSGRIYFQLDKRWPDAKKKEISTLFSLDSILIEKAFEGKSPFIVDSVTWEVTNIDANKVELSKPLPQSQSSYSPGDVMLLDDSWIMMPFKVIPFFSITRKYGVNKFAKETAVRYENGEAHFYLPGYQKTGKVYLSGSFNNWSTMELPMQKTATGWQTSVKLAPGKYLYKYIADGKWIPDPNNLLKENDGESGFNSILYCYNYVFKLQGSTDAKKVYLAGGFNNWKKKDLKMNRVPGGWSLPLFLEEGTYAYKFIVDGLWIPDPGNRNTRTDAYGNMNSFIGIGDTLVFKLNGFNSAEKVVLSGSFNNWSPNELLMNKAADGWELPYVIGAGNFEYKFLVDGKWMPDPANPVTSGSGNFVNSCLVVRPNYTFRLKQFADAKTVIVTGSFNGWNEDSFRMVKNDGEWTYSVYLKPGKHTYKFIVDGQWMIDPANEVWEENIEGTGNSVLWIEP